MTALTWGSDRLPLHLTLDPAGPVTVGLAPALRPEAADQPMPPMVELLVLGEGRARASGRLDRTVVGERMHYVAHRERRLAGVDRLEVEQRDDVTGLRAVTTLERLGAAGAYRIGCVIHNDGVQTVTLQAAGVSLRGLVGFLGPADRTEVWTAHSEWCAENRWSHEALTGAAGLPDINPRLHDRAARSSYARSSSSTWSSGSSLPVAALSNEATGRALAWEVESNGPWRWELNTQYRADDFLTLALSGPNDLDHGWITDLRPGDSFATVTASFAPSLASWQGAIGELTRHRRSSRLCFAADAGRGLVFNDYMNALMGDPTVERLLPLIDAAARVGARYFCIDAGWYDDSGAWWPSVGAWEPSVTRFGSLGLPGVLAYVRDAGMRPGLWIEPEVIGVDSPKARELPEEAFMHRHGVRIVEHSRYFLDFRSAEARGYLDGVFARLVEQYGVRYFKWDYNVTPGSGPDSDALGPGAGLLGHARALLAWVEDLRRRYPDVVLEACSSGAQRADAATLARYDLQSTSDQQDYRLYPVIAAAAPMSMAFEQAGNWAYPQSGMSVEQVAFTLVTGLAGRLYLSGTLNALGAEQEALVREATALYPAIMAHHAQSVPAWPLGLPAWHDRTVAVASVGERSTLLFV